MAAPPTTSYGSHLVTANAAPVLQLQPLDPHYIKTSSNLTHIHPSSNDHIHPSHGNKVLVESNICKKYQLLEHRSSSSNTISRLVSLNNIQKHKKSFRIIHCFQSSYNHFKPHPDQRRTSSNNQLAHSWAQLSRTQFT